MEYKKVDFTAHKVKKYESVRAVSAGSYHHNTSFFGSVTLTPYLFPRRSNDLLNQNEIQEKNWETTEK